MQKRFFPDEGDAWFPLPKHDKLEDLQEGDHILANGWLWRVEYFKGNWRAIAQRQKGRESGAGIVKKT